MAFVVRSVISVLMLMFILALGVVAAIAVAIYFVGNKRRQHGLYYGTMARSMASVTRSANIHRPHNPAVAAVQRGTMASERHHSLRLP